MSISVSSFFAAECGFSAVGRSCRTEGGLEATVIHYRLLRYNNNVLERDRAVLSGARVLAADPSSPRPADSWLDRGGSMPLASPYSPFSNRFWGEARSILRQGAPPPSGNAVVRVLLMLLICVCRITVLLLQMHLLVGSISVLKTSIYSSDIKGSMPASERQWCMKWHKIEIIK